MRILFTATLFYLLFGLLTEAKAQSGPVDPQTAVHLQNQLDLLIGSNNLKGLSASVIIPNKGTWNGVAGWSHGNVLIDTAMVFGIGSITKTIVATTVLQLVQDGLLSLSDSIHTWLPNPYPNVNPNITVQQLLQHRSGLFNYTENQVWGTAVSNNLNATWSAEQILNNYILPPYSAPNVAFRYSNTNFALLGRIIEEVTDSAWWDVVRYRLLEPNQLEDIFAVVREPATGTFPHNWAVQPSNGNLIDIFGQPKTAPWTASDAAGIMGSNAYDLARFGQTVFLGEVLQDTMLQLMKQFIPQNAGIYTGYGLGLMRFSSGNTQAWGHNGGISGFSSCLMFSPADSIVVSLLSNTSSNVTLLAWELLQTARQQLVNYAPTDAVDLTNELFCYPNPAHGTGTIRFRLKKDETVEITLENSIGQTVKTLLSEPQTAGEHALKVDTGTLPSGMYFCTMQTASSKLVQRWIISR